MEYTKIELSELINQAESYLNQKDIDDISLNTLKRLNKKICLIKANFKCECCSRDDDLTLHHLIVTRVKNYTNFNKYLILRNNYKNIIVLCRKCHMKYHRFIEKDEEEMGTIQPKVIESLKQKCKSI